MGRAIGYNIKRLNSQHHFVDIIAEFNNTYATVDTHFICLLLFLFSTEALSLLLWHKNTQVAINMKSINWQKFVYRSMSSFAKMLLVL